MLDFYRTMAQALAKEAVVLATVVRVRGSVPREVGAKMLVYANGAIAGTIGGGAGEARVHAQALKVLQSAESTWVEIDLTGTPQQNTQGVCGGTMQVWLARWPVSQLGLVQDIVSRLELGQLVTLVTPLLPEQTPYLWPSNSPLQDLLDQPDSQADALSDIQVTETHLIEPLLPPPHLIIVGAGHIAVPLADIAECVGFQITVVDDRADFVTRDRFPSASRLVSQPLANALASLPLAMPPYVALVTRGYTCDLEALRALLMRPTHYLGMIGSEKRVQKVLKVLEQEGYNPTALQQIYAPIGLDIGAMTPAEIAVSICAELIKVRRGGTGRSLSTH